MIMLEDGMILYHGSYAPINKIDLSLCAQGKDFGKGFYLTENFEQAKKFIGTSLRKAKNIGKISSDRDYGYVTTFKFKNAGIPVYTFDNADKEWLWFVSMNRRSNFAEEFKCMLKKEIFDAEIIAGKIANDTTNPTIMAYLNGLYGNVKSDTAINFAISRLMPDNLKNQYCFLSERAVSCLEFVEVNRYDG